jgi:Holliday junction resolvase
MRYRTRVDANQKEVDIALRAAGASVVSLGDVGHGCPDRLVGYKGETYLIETKNRAREKSQSVAARANMMRTPDQTKFHESWRGRPVIVAYTPDEALRAIGASR